METLETSHGVVAYDIRGGAGPADSGTDGTVVMLPAGAHSRDDFDELRALLPPRFRTIAIDWPSHGDSPAAEGLCSATRFADLAEEAVAELAPRGAVVLGNSVGGFAAARLALRRPDLVRGLVVVDGGGFDGNPPQARLFCSLMGRPWFLRRFYPTFSKLYMRARTEADRLARERAIATTGTDPGLVAVCGLWRSFASLEHDLREQAPDIAVPTLVVWGRHDRVIPLRVGRRLAESIPTARLAVLEAGHVPQTSDPAGFAAELTPFAEAAFAAAPFG